MIGKSIAGITGSTALLVPAIFLLAYLFLFQFGQKGTDESELTDLGLPPPIAQMTRTLPKFLTSPSKPQVLLMGSSLVLSPAYMLEKLIHRPDYDCTYFEDALKQRTGKQISVTNVGVVGAMACDQYAILKTALNTGKKPDFVIFGLAPRDFTDNLTTVENSPTQKVLTCYGSTNKLFPESLKSEDCALSFNMHKVTIDRWLKRIRKTATQSACQLYNHPASIEQTVPANSLAKAERTHRVVLATDIVDYRNRYNPPNYDRLKEQAAYLNSLLQLCRKEQIPVLLVNMPITQLNRRLIDPSLLEAVEHKVSETALSYHVPFLNLDKTDSRSFDDYTDFTDSVHLAASGGKKFFNILSDYLVSDRTFSQVFQTPLPAVAQREKGGVY